MNAETMGEAKPPTWFWIVSGIGLIWNGLGLMAFFNQMTMDLGELLEAQRVFHETTPTWATAAFGVAVFGGALGCLALLLRKSWAVPMLLICLAGIVVQIFHALVVSNGLDVFGPEGLVLPILTFSIGVFLAWFAYHSKGKGWLS